MVALLLTFLIACGDKQDDTSTEAVETQPSSEPSTEDTSSEQPSDTATSTQEA